MICLCGPPTTRASCSSCGTRSSRRSRSQSRGGPEPRRRSASSSTTSRMRPRQAITTKKTVVTDYAQIGLPGPLQALPRRASLPAAACRARRLSRPAHRRHHGRSAGRTPTLQSAGDRACRGDRGAGWCSPRKRPTARARGRGSALRELGHLESHDPAHRRAACPPLGGARWLGRARERDSRGPERRARERHVLGLPGP